MLGIDIAFSSVKILEISRLNNTFCVERYASKELPPNAVEGQLVKDIDAVSSCIQLLCETAKFDTTKAVLAVPDSSIISKVVSIQRDLSLGEIEDLLLTEVEKHIPYPMHEINLDYEIQGPCITNPALLNVLIVASRAQPIKSRVEAVEKAGLEVGVVDVESFAVARVASRLISELSMTNKTVAIVNFGDYCVNLLVLHQGKLIYCREEKFDGQMLSNGARLFLTPVNQLILSQIKRSLQFFYASNPHQTIAQLFLAGDWCHELGLVNQIQEGVGIPTSAINPFSQMAWRKKRGSNFKTLEASRFLVACGLALRGIE